MPHCLRLVQLTLALPPADYRAYTAAARLLTRIMGRKAPDAFALIRHTLGGRDVTGIADDYLDAISWPTAAKHAAWLRRPAPPPARCKPSVATHPRLPLARERQSLDPSRN
jgi:hypothetical protein